MDLVSLKKDSGGTVDLRFGEAQGVQCCDNSQGGVESL